MRLGKEESLCGGVVGPATESSRAAAFCLLKKDAADSTQGS